MDILNRYTGAPIKTIAADSLRGANLCEANLRGADLRGADLRGANDGLACGNYLRITGSRHPIKAVDAANVSIGCYQNSLEWWREHYAGVGRKESYTDAQIEEYRLHIEYVAAWLAVRARPVKAEVENAETR